jgi:hypothetical protein
MRRAQVGVLAAMALLAAACTAEPEERPAPSGSAEPSPTPSDDGASAPTLGDADSGGGICVEIDEDVEVVLAAPLTATEPLTLVEVGVVPAVADALVDDGLVLPDDGETASVTTIDAGGTPEGAEPLAGQQVAAGETIRVGAVLALTDPPVTSGPHRLSVGYRLADGTVDEVVGGTELTFGPSCAD